jgi:hypothetical protein
MSTTDWNESELRVAILQALLAARKKNPRLGGVPGFVVMNYLDAKIVQFEETLHWLVDQHLIEVGESVFLITVKVLNTWQIICLLPIPLSVPLVRPGQLHPLVSW